MEGIGLLPNLKAAQAFLDILEPNGLFTFQTFDDRKLGIKQASLSRVFHGTLDQHHDTLAYLQQKGAGAFVMINRGDGIVHPGNKTCRKSVNVTSIRSVFADLDGAPLEHVLAGDRPDIVVESSPKRWHCYWLTNDCPLAEFKAIQKKIAQKFNGDREVHDLPRVMRLPGFWHQKAAPFMTHMIFPSE
jgi:hypothetical protein